MRITVLAKKIKKYKVKKERDEDKEIEEDSPYSRFIGGYARSKRRERTPEEKREYRKLALFLLVWSVFLASVYYTCVQLEFGPVMPIYTVAGAALFLVWLVFNGGFKKIEVEKFEKPDDMGYDEYCSRIEKLKERQRKSKYYLVLFLPFLVIMLVDYLIIVWGAKMANAPVNNENEEIKNLILKFINIII